jgi:hypothetical protein
MILLAEYDCIAGITACSKEHKMVLVQKLPWRVSMALCLQLGSYYGENGNGVRMLLIVHESQVVAR